MQDGSIELMVHRRTLHDDSQGVGEPINETAYGQGLVIRGRHNLLFQSPTTSALYHRPAARNLYLSPMMTFALSGLSFDDYSRNYYQTWSALNDVLPYNVHLLTIDQLDINIFLVRLEHYFELNEDATYSKSVQIDLQLIFNHLGTINDVLELTLAANLPLSQLERLVWTTDDGISSNSKSMSKKSFVSKQKPCVTILDADTSTMITLNPMEIRTFQITLT